jgi:hypothetical protein
MKIYVADKRVEQPWQFPDDTAFSDAFAAFIGGGNRGGITSGNSMNFALDFGNVNAVVVNEMPDNQKTRLIEIVFKEGTTLLAFVHGGDFGAQAAPGQVPETPDLKFAAFLNGAQEKRVFNYIRGGYRVVIDFNRVMSVRYGPPAAFGGN